MTEYSEQVPSRKREFYLQTPARSPFEFNLGEALRYWQLIPLFVRRDFVSEFSQTLLGPLWFVIHPIMQSLVFSLLFGALAKMSTDDVTPFLFYNAALVLWTYFTQSSTYVSQVFLSNGGLFGKVQFPRIIMPISISIFRMVTLFANFAVFIVFLGIFYFRGANVEPNLWVLATPFLFIHVALLSFGLGTLVSAFTSRSRDMVQAFSYLLSLGMYASPIIYPLSAVPENLYYLFYLNPIAAPIELFRYAYLGSGSFDSTMYAISLLETAALVLIGLMAFSYTEKTVVDTI